MRNIIPTLVLVASSIVGCSSDNSLAPSVGQASTENPLLGLWRYEYEASDNVESDGSVDLDGEYIEVAGDSFVFYTIDGTSNCYAVETVPFRNLYGDTYSADLGGTGDSEFNMEVVEPTLLLYNGKYEIDDYDENNQYVVVSEDGKILEVHVILKYARVENISPQDLNSCTS